MIARRVTQVTLVHDPVAHEGHWHVEWSEVRGKKAAHLTKDHGTETSARRHVQGLLEMRASGLSMDAVYSERLGSDGA